jgi:hypothetical protein
MTRSWYPEVVADSSGTWLGNALRFQTKEEAEASASDLQTRWILVTRTRAMPSDDQINYRWDFANRRSVPVQEEVIEP